MNFRWIYYIAALLLLPALQASEPEMRQSVRGEVLTVNGDRVCNWFAGNTPGALQIYGGSAAGSLEPESLRIFAGERELIPGTDFTVDPVWSKFVLTDAAGVESGTQLTLDYQYRLRRIDSVIRDRDGQERTVIGTPALNLALPPPLPEGAELLVNVYHDYAGTTNYPVTPEATATATATATTRGRIPRTLGKLQRGETVRIVCWGDSVTAGAEATAGNAYPAVFARRLQERFPSADLEVKVIAVPGSSSTNWLWPREYPYGAADWALVAAEKPDLIVLEFVNDAGLSSVEAVEGHYGEIWKRIRELNAEVILLTPHFTCPEMMQFPPGMEGRECHPYVAGLRAFATRHQLGLADAAARWEGLAAVGIPYMTLLVNAINHPDDRGHLLFVEELLENFD